MILALFAVVLVGLATALEAPTNAMITRSSGSALWAGLAAAIVGGATTLVLILLTRPKLAADWWSAPPAWIWVGGIYGAFVVVLSAWATPKLGAGTALVVIVAAQVALGVVLDHFGLIGLKAHAAGWLRIAGALLVIAGAAMVALG